MKIENLDYHYNYVIITKEHEMLKYSDGRIIICFDLNEGKSELADDEILVPLDCLGLNFKKELLENINIYKRSV